MMRRSEARRVSQPKAGRLEEGRRSEGRKGVIREGFLVVYDAGTYLHGAWCMSSWMDASMGGWQISEDMSIGTACCQRRPSLYRISLSAERMGGWDGMYFSMLQVRCMGRSVGSGFLKDPCCVHMQVCVGVA
jgi:hypothetical protein